MRKASGWLLGVTLGLGLGGMVLAGDFVDAVVARLQNEGYGSVQIETTWLGRVRILAEKDGVLREIILNPRTGEILRDLWTLRDGEFADSEGMAIASGGRSGSGGTDQSGPDGEDGSADGTDGGDDDGSDGGSDGGGDDDGGSSGSDDDGGDGSGDGSDDDSSGSDSSGSGG